ncbi:L-fucose:H+ symporter permease [Mucilaginibacter sp. 3215]|uniref:L-fucose:H+ symporter permease n=1 Tax=Mucilaginibacter sp. 3215 TaxID=3373912 RepID=UPI003D19BDED
MSKNNALFAVALITSLFFIWGFALNLNPILIPHLKKACQLNDLQSSLIDSASYIAYFILPIPAAQFMKKYGYKGGIILGLILFSTGAFLFFPAAAVRNYAFFLAALFIVFSGAAFLETAANPYITVLGDPAGAERRINFSQSFNGLAATLAPLIGGRYILSGKVLTDAESSKMSPEQLNEYLNHEASSVQIPFLVIGAVVLVVAFLIYRTHFPPIVEETSEEAVNDNRSLGVRISELLHVKSLRAGIFAEFLYVGAQAGISSFFIRYSEKVAGFAEKPASFYLTIASAGFMAGRFIGTLLMRYFNPVKLLITYAIINIFLIAMAVTLKGEVAVYALMCTWFFMSIMFPTIFSLSIRGLGAKTKLGSSLVIMGIVGGAIFPVIMGRVSDATHNIQMAYVVPGFCFLGILIFAINNHKVKKLVMAGSH